MFKLFVFKMECPSGIELFYKNYDEASKMLLQLLKQGYVVRIEQINVKKV
jgi:hypothetical protein